MANIPLSEIPNAPRMPEPVLTQYPNARIDLSRAAGQMEAPTIEQGAFDGPAKGLQAVGAGIEKVGGVFAQLSERMMDSKNRADVGRAEDIMEKAESVHAKESANMSPQDAAALWEKKYRPQVLKDFGGLKMSAWTRDQIEPKWVQFDGRARTNATYAGYARQVQADQQVMLDRVSKARERGDFEAGLAGIDAMVAAHHLTPEQAAAMKVKFDHDVQTEGMRMLAQTNPGALAEIAVEGERTGTSKELPMFDGKKEEFTKLKKWATAIRIGKEVDTQYDIGDRIRSGEITSEAGVREAAGAFLTERQVQSLTRLAANDPDYDATALTQLRTAVRAFQPGSDRDHGAYEALLGKIQTSVPKVLQKEFSDELYQAWQGRGKITPESVARWQQSEVFAQVDAYVKTGLLGEGRHASGMKAEFLKSQMADFIKKNPQASAKERTEWLSDRVGKDVVKSLLRRREKLKAPSIWKF